MNFTYKSGLLLLVLLLLTKGAYTQKSLSNNNQDNSIELTAESVNKDSFESLIQQSTDLLYQNTDSAIYLANRAYQIALTSRSTENSATALGLVGTGNLIIGRLDQATENLKLTSKYWEEVGDTIQSAKTMNNLGIVYHYKEDRDSAIYYYTQSLQLYISLKDTSRIVASYNNLGVNQASRSNYKLALEYYQRALEIQLLNKFKDNEVLLNIAYLNNNIGSMYLYLEQVDDALEYFSRTLAIDTVQNEAKLLAATKTNVGVCYYQKGQYNLAEKVLREGIELSKVAKNRDSYSRAYKYLGRIYENKELFSTSLSAFRESLNPDDKEINPENEPDVDPEVLVDIGRVYLKLYNLSQAEKYARDAVNAARETEDLETEADAFRLLSLVYEDMNQEGLALTYERLHSKMSDSLNTLIADREYLEMRTLFEADRQKQELELQNVELARQDAEITKRRVQSRNLWLTLGSVLILFFSALYNIYRVQKNNEKLVGLNKEIKSQRDLLNVQAQKLTVQARKLRIVNDDMKKFSLALGHDLKQPLTTIQGYTDLIKKEFNKQEHLKGSLYANYLDDSIGRMNSRIHHLVEYIRTGENLRRDEVNLNEIIAQVSNDLHGSINDNHVELDIHQLPKVKGDSEMLSRLFQNLISNSIKYRRQEVDPNISIDYMPNGAFNIISITDNGMGIKEKYLQSIFNLFDRGDRTDEKEGTGIGLATCKRIVELHGGKIEVDSEVGVGTTFSLYFPKYS